MNFEKTYGIVDPMRLAEWHEHKDGGSFLIAPLNNPLQIEENIKLMRVDGSSETDEQTVYDAKVLSCEILAKSVLLDWKDVTDNDDNVLNYTSKDGAAILYKYNEFRDWVVEKAKEASDEQESKKEAIVKN